MTDIEKQELSDKLNNYLAYKKRWQSEAIDFPRLSNFITEDELLILADTQSAELLSARERIRTLEGALTAHNDSYAFDEDYFGSKLHKQTKDALNKDKQ